MKHLLDTCVVSEITKPRPAPGVLDWISGQPADGLFISVMTLGELVRGVRLQPDGARKRRLHAWLESEFRPSFEGRLLDVDADVAERWGMISSHAQHRGISLSTTDMLIAATALVHGLTVVTRNVRDFEPTGALLLNPWN